MLGAGCLHESPGEAQMTALKDGKGANKLAL